MVTGRRQRILRPGPGDVILSDWEAAGLRIPSVVRAGRLLVLAQHLVAGRLGELTDDDRGRIDRGLASVLGLSTAPDT